MRPIEIGPDRPRTETTQGLNDSPLTVKAESTRAKIGPKRPCLTNTGPKRPIFLKQVASFFSLYPNIVAFT